MKKYESLEELRKNIDEIDLKILDLIEKRKDLVTKVVSVKKRDQIIDQKRIEFILNKLKIKISERTPSFIQNLQSFVFFM